MSKRQANNEGEKARGYMMGQEAVRELFARWGEGLAKQNLRSLELDRSREPFDVGYLEGYRDACAVYGITREPSVGTETDYGVMGNL